MANDDEFWRNCDRLLAGSRIVIDRPKGTPHPRYPAMIYPYDYGHLDNTTGGDGDGVDVWIGSLPDRNVTGIVCTVDLDKRDSETKFLMGCTLAESQQILSVHNQGGQSAIYVDRRQV